MARAVPKIRHDRPQISRSTARREIAAVRHLYRLNKELATDAAELERKRLLRASALMAFAQVRLRSTAWKPIGAKYPREPPNVRYKS
jgi:phage tail tape-measure protein